MMKLDAHDVKIIEMLQRDARTSIRDIAASSGLTSPTVSARIKAMEDAGVLSGYHAEIPPSSLGQEVIELIVKARPSDVEAVGQALAGIALVREVHIASGGRVLVTAVFGSSAEQESILNAVGAIPLIAEYDHFMVVGTKKKEPWTIVAEGAKVSMPCYYCRKPIEGTPYKIRLDGRDHFLCCPICEREYRKKYSALKEKAEAK